MKKLTGKKVIKIEAPYTGINLKDYNIEKRRLQLELLTIQQKAAKLGKAFSETIESGPMAYTLFMMGLDFGLGPSYEVVIVGDPEAQDTKTMIDAVRKNYSPSKVVLTKASDIDEITEIAGFTKSQSSIDGKATAYVCLNQICNLPTTDINKMLESISPED